MGLRKVRDERQTGSRMRRGRNGSGTFATERSTVAQSVLGRRSYAPSLEATWSHLCPAVLCPYLRTRPPPQCSSLHHCRNCEPSSATFQLSPLRSPAPDASKRSCHFSPHSARPPPLPVDSAHCQWCQVCRVGGGGIGK